MKKYPSVLFIILVSLTTGQAQLKVKNLRVENRSYAMGIDNPMPRFSWQLSSEKKNTMQTAYEIRMGLKDTKTTLWNSGKQMSDQSQYAPYGGGALQSAQSYYWQVRVWDNSGRVSDWSDIDFWQMGLLKTTDWQAKWIESESAADTVNGPALLFRKEFTAKKKIRSASLFVTAHGMYEAFVNGLRISEGSLTPGWTSYHKRLQYQVYNVTNLVKGKNAIGIDVGSGWYRTPLAWDNNRNIYGKKLALLAQLIIYYDDGSQETVVTDNGWKTSDRGPVRSSEIYDGEIYDARLEMADWDKPGFNDQSWQPVSEKDFPKNTLVATYNEPVKRHQSFNPVRILTTPKGEQVVDFGQNLVGWESIVVEGKAGDTIEVDHAEVLDKNGNFYTDNLRAAKSRNMYVLRGGGTEYLMPHFTFHGFRFVRLKGLHGPIKTTAFPESKALHDDRTFGNLYINAFTLYSDMDSTGHFSCSNPMLNQLQHNIMWGQRGNFLDVPTDCPQRDERLGWTGDAQAFSRTASFNMDVHNFFAKWLKDVAADQGDDGIVPFVVPNVLGPRAGGSAGWSDVATIIPWNMWLAYGDVKILDDQYASMKAWVDFIQHHSEHDLWDKGFHFGDWLFYRPADDNDGRAAVTDKYLIAQCFYAHSTQLLINAATVLNKTNDVQQYTNLLKKIKDAFVKEYLTPSGRLISSTQTAYVLALQFDMLPESLRDQAAKRLVTNIVDYDNHLTTGFLGTPYLCHVLSRYGYDTVAFKLLLQDTYPSWLYPVKMGATTIWERWDGQKPDSSFQTPGMNSFNHYAYGAIGDWMYRNITGIDVEDGSAGYKKIIIKPHTGGRLSYANADLQTGYGKISAHWKITNASLMMDVEIPPNTTANIYIPAGSADVVTESGKNLASVQELKVKGPEGKYLVVQTGSGVYHFSAPLMKE